MIIIIAILSIVLFLILYISNIHSYPEYTIDNPPNLKQTFTLCDDKGNIIDFEKFVKNIESGDQLSEECIPNGIFLSKNEVPLVILNNVCLFQEKTQSKYIYDNSGASFRITKGLTLRNGTGERTRVSNKYLDYLDEGDLLITNLGMYFKGKVRSEKVIFNKIVGILFREYGITINKTEHKTITFEGVDTNMINRIISARKIYEKSHGKMVSDL